MKLFKSNTVRVLTATGAILSTIWSFGDNLGIPPEYLDYIEKTVTFLGIVLGVKFRADTENKQPLHKR